MTTETDRDLSETVRAAALERCKPEATFILPWRMANQDDLHAGLGDCGCGYCPDDDQRPLSGLVMQTKVDECG
jgi:hypothetical protein